jgi:hypothetical protein
MVTTDFTPLVKEPGSECDHVPPYGAKFKNKSFCTFTALCAPWHVQGQFYITLLFSLEVRNVDLREAHISGRYVEFMKLDCILIKKIPIQITSP